MNSKIVPQRGTAHNGNVSIVYEKFGPSTGKPLLLITGVGMQMLIWHDDLCCELVRRGFQVVRMDNRDVGLSTHLSQYGEPNLFKMIFMPKTIAAYHVTDMAADAIAVMDAMGWKSANVVGGSMGGMIAQTMAIDFPNRIRTLTSIMSSPSTKIGRAKLALSIKMGRLMHRPLHNESEAAQQMIDFYKLIGTPLTNYLLDETWLREVGAESYKRSYDPAGKLRQQTAFLASPDRTKDLRKLDLPTLVMHGEVDPMIQLKGGKATAEAIQGAKLVILPGIGHGAFPRKIWPIIIDNICTLTNSD